MKKFFYSTFLIIAIRAQVICGMTDEFNLDSLWERVFWSAINKGKFERAIKALGYIESPENILNSQNDHGNVPLIEILKKSMSSGINPLELIKFLLNEYLLYLNLQDGEGNTFFMSILNLYDDLHKFKNGDTVGAVAKLLVKFILESDNLRSKLDLDLRNQQGETVKDIAVKVTLDPALAKLIDLEISPRRRTIKNLWNSFVGTNFRSNGAV